MPAISNLVMIVSHWVRSRGAGGGGEVPPQTANQTLCGWGSGTCILTRLALSACAHDSYPWPGLERTGLEQGFKLGPRAPSDPQGCQAQEMQAPPTLNLAPASNVFYISGLGARSFFFSQ